MNRLMQDLTVDRADHPDAAQRDRWDPEEDDDDDQVEDDKDVNIIDRSMFPFPLPIWLVFLFSFVNLHFSCDAAPADRLSSRRLYSHLESPRFFSLKIRLRPYFFL